MGVAWTAIVAAELAVGAKAGGGGSGGIGQMMFVFYAYSIELNRIIVCMIAVGIVALALDRLMRAGIAPCRCPGAADDAAIRIDCSGGKRFPAAGRQRRPSRWTDFTLDIAQGEFLVIVGPSGCGKTTSSTCWRGSISRVRAVMLDGRAIHGPGPERGVMFQDYALFPWRTVWGNVEFGLRHGRRATGSIRPRGNAA